MARPPLSLGELIEHWTLVGDEFDLVSAKHLDTRLTFALLLIARLLLLPTSDIVAQMMALGFLAPHEHPGLLARLRREPALIGSAVDELLRYLSVLHTGLPRAAVEDVEVSGCLIKAGEGVICSLPTAHRDPGRLLDPAQLDITRDSRRHLARTPRQVGGGAGRYPVVNAPERGFDALSAAAAAC